IWWTHRINNVWTTPEKAPFTGTYYNSEPFITPSNQKMFFVSTRDGTTIFQLWTMNRSGTNWGTPQQLGAPISNKNKMGPTAASNGNLYYSQLDDDGRSYFYMARNNAGVFDAPVKLSAAVNAFYFQAHLFVAPDESYIVFDAIPTQQSTGSSIYASFKKNDGTWGNAIKLGSAINSTDNQYLPYVSPDGKYLFFTKNGDLWWVDAKAVTDLKPVGVIRNEREGMPEIFQLRQNYPNPFNPATMIRYALPSFAHVSLTIHDMLGREIAVLVNGEQPAGWKEEQWNAANVASGMYLCRLQADEFVETKRLMLVK
ncbi:MAG: T9SS type A sorting domain-containing protein, partial [Ignavibacteriales bacterium]|nr:T9SS type A sorting domain-containing protein [Ignavibacteriales bacterium]